MCFFFSEAQISLAAAKCFFRRRSTASALNRPPRIPWKAILSWAALVSFEPCFKNSGDGFAQRNGTLLSPLAEDFDMSARAEGYVLTFRAGHYGQAQACLQGCQQERVVPAAAPGALVRHIEKCVDFRARHEVDQLAVKALVRHGEDALDLSTMGRHLIGGEAEERPDGGETEIAGARGNATRLLKFVQKRRDERGIDHFEWQAIPETCATVYAQIAAEA